MNKYTISTIALAISLAFSANATAKNLSKDEYKAAEKRITAEYKSDKASCASLSANAKDICKAKAKGKNNVAMAELEAQYKPSKKATYNVGVAKAESDYAVANEQCDDKAGNDKDVCEKEAKATLVHAKADAKVQMTTSEANATAKQETTDARTKAQEKDSDARKDAAKDKTDADYKVAIQKCDEFASDKKDLCVSNAKTKYGK